MYHFVVDDLPRKFNQHFFKNVLINFHANIKGVISISLIVSIISGAL